MNKMALDLAYESIGIALDAAQLERNEIASGILKVCLKLLGEVITPGEFTKAAREFTRENDRVVAQDQP